MITIKDLRKEYIIDPMNMDYISNFEEVFEYLHTLRSIIKKYLGLRLCFIVPEVIDNYIGDKHIREAGLLVVISVNYDKMNTENVEIEVDNQCKVIEEFFALDENNKLDNIYIAGTSDMDYRLDYRE